MKCLLIFAGLACTLAFTFASTHTDATTAAPTLPTYTCYDTDKNDDHVHNDEIKNAGCISPPMFKHDVTTARGTHCHFIVHGQTHPTKALTQQYNAFTKTKCIAALTVTAGSSSTAAPVTTSEGSTTPALTSLGVLEGHDVGCIWTPGADQYAGTLECCCIGDYCTNTLNFLNISELMNHTNVHSDNTTNPQYVTLNHMLSNAPNYMCHMTPSHTDDHMSAKERSRWGPLQIALVAVFVSLTFILLVTNAAIRRAAGSFSNVADMQPFL